MYKRENEEEHPAFDCIDIDECKQLQDHCLGKMLFVCSFLYI